MPQIINEKGIGQVLGENLGTGLSQGLQGLANLRMNQLSQRQQTNQASQFWQGLGLPQNIAHQFASAPEAVQKSLLDRLEGLNIGSQQQQQVQPQQMNSLSQFSSPAIQTPQAQEVLGLGKQQSNQLGAQQQGGLKIGTNPAERRHREDQALKREIHQENQALKKQAAIDKTNAPYIKQLDTDIGPASRIYTLAQQMKALLDTGKVSATFGGYTPGILQNTETQQFDSKSKELATELAGAGKGVATNYKIKMAQESKPLLSHKRATQEQLIKDVIEKMGKVVDSDRARQELIAENNGNQPANIRFEVARRLKKPEFKLDLPEDTYEDGSEVTEGDIIKVNGRQFERTQGYWKSIG